MDNIVDSIGFDLERVHTGLIVYLVDLWRSGKLEPLQSFFHALDVDLQGTKEIKAKKEYENIDLVLCGESDKRLVAIEMKIHNRESLVAVKGPGGGKAYQTVEYSRRVNDCQFLYVTLGVGEYYRREPYGNVRQVGLDRFLTAVKEISDFDPIIRAWEESLRTEKEFRTACREGCKSGKDVKKWNVYFLSFLREDLESSMPNINGADFTVYRLNSDTILNSGIKKPSGTEGAYCYMEINQNGKLNLKANLEPLSSQGDKRAYVKKAKDHYNDLVYDWFNSEKTYDSKNLKKSRTIMSFDVGINVGKQDKFFTYEDGVEQTSKRIGEVMRWFSEKPPVETD